MVDCVQLAANKAAGDVANRRTRWIEKPMLDSLGLRVLEGLPHFVSLAIPQVRVRFQIAPGTEAGLGIDAAPYEVLVSGTVVVTGTTDANGEVSVPLLLVTGGNCAIKIFGTEYPLTLLAAWDPVTDRSGKQQRFDHLGYVHGYQLDTTIDPPADGTLTERYHHSINNFQWDQDIAVDGDPGPVTRGRLTTATGGV